MISHGVPTPEARRTNLLFGNIFAEGYMKMKEFGPRGGRASLALSFDPPLDPVISSLGQSVIFSQKTNQ